MWGADPKIELFCGLSKRGYQSLGLVISCSETGLKKYLWWKLPGTLKIVILSTGS